MFEHSIPLLKMNFKGLINLQRARKVGKSFKSKMANNLSKTKYFAHKLRGLKHFGQYSFSTFGPCWSQVLKRFNLRLVLYQVQDRKVHLKNR